MNLTVSQESLIDLISKVQNIVEKRTTMPILSHILLEAKEGYLKIYVTDLEISLTDRIKVEEFLEDGKVVIDSRKFYQIIKELDEGLVKLIKNENQLQISQLKTYVNIMSLNVEEYPTFPVTYSKNPFYIQSVILKEMIEKTIHSVSDSESRYQINGVYFEQFQDEYGLSYKMVSTDGHRLSLITRLAEEISSSQNEEPLNNETSTQEESKNDKNKEDQKEDSTSDFEGVIIPRKGLNEIKRLLDRNKDNVEICIEGVQLIVKQCETLLLIRLIEGAFPDYKLFIPDKIEKEIQVSRDRLVSSLKRASILTTEKSRSVSLFFSEGRLKITSQTPDLGDIKEDLDIHYVGDDLKIEFNVQYLLDFLTSFEEETVYIGLNHSESGGVFRPLNDKDYNCVIMPMKL